MSTRNITSLDGSSYEAIHSSISQKFFHIPKCLACDTETLLQLKITTKKNITNFINTQIYIPILYVTKMTQNKNDSIIIIENNHCVLFPTSRFP